ncbi:hypothetical protein BDQ17DRAFT_1273216 [Cyathus striatus]|nr:hypothetical protein BDQ17DRAFT_1273216 [Cyathus striatus]
MSVIQDEALFQYADRVKDKVVIITGGANGIGREAALRFAQYGAKVVIADLDIDGGKRVVKEITSSGGSAISIKCNVIIWEDQVAMFELAISTFGAVDIVVPNAGVSETSPFGTVKFKDGKPVKPRFLTLDVNITGVLYTVHLAQHYLLINRVDLTAVKSIVLIGSMASWQAIPKGELYSASKHAILGLMRSLHIPLEMVGIRIAVVHPWFADTSIVPAPVKLFLAGIPLTPVSRVAGAIFRAASDPQVASNGSVWLLADNGPVFLLPREELKEGVYKLIDDRVNSLLVGVRGIQYYGRVLGDVFRIVGRPVVTVGVTATLANLAWNHRSEILGYLKTVTA